jgi:hypothetical protein
MAMLMELRGEAAPIKIPMLPRISPPSRAATICISRMLALGPRVAMPWSSSRASTMPSVSRCVFLLPLLSCLTYVPCLCDLLCCRIHH